MFISITVASKHMFSKRPELLTNSAYWTSFDAPGFNGTIKTVSPIVKFSGNLEVGRDRPPVVNGADPAEWPAEVEHLETQPTKMKPKTVPAPTQAAPLMVAA